VNLLTAPEQPAAVAGDGRPTASERTKDLVLWTAGAIGVLALLWFAASQLLGLSVIVFRTGSMSPGMPQGAAAVSEEVAATELRVGDVITVSRGEDELPVTHRIVRIDEIAGDAGRRSVVLQGDANATPDREPYVIGSVPRVLWSAPKLGAAVIALQTPAAMGGITVSLAALLTWGLWPARGERTSDEGGVA
jgi:signal peptidase